MRKLWVLSLCCAAFAPSAFAIDLLTLYKKAQTNDAVLAAARFQREADAEKLPQARAGLLPNLNASASTTWNDSDTQKPIETSRRFNSNGYQIQLSQPVFNWQNWVQYQQGKTQVGIAQVQLELAKQDLIVRTVKAYFDVLLAQDTVQSLGSLKRAASEQLQLAKQSFDVGTVTVTDVHEAQSRFDLAVAQEIAAQNDLEVKREAVRVLIGEEPVSLQVLRPNAVLNRPEPDDINAWIEAAQKNNLSVQSQKLNYELSQQAIAQVRAQHLPTVDLVANHSRNGSGSSSLGSASQASTNSIGLQLNIPLYQGGLITSRDRQAVALKEKTRNDLEGATRNAILAARQAYLGVTSGIAQTQGLAAAVVSSQSALDSNRLGYEVGVRINIDVLNAQSQLADAQQKYAKARYDTLVSQIQLKQAAGTLEESDVAAVNALLSAE